MQKFWRNPMLDSFFAIGVSYIKSDAETRGKFSLDGAAGESLSRKAKDLGIEALLTISTCNRTELYGYTEDAETLIPRTPNIIIAPKNCPRGLIDA